MTVRGIVREVLICNLILQILKYLVLELVQIYQCPANLTIDKVVSDHVPQNCEGSALAKKKGSHGRRRKVGNCANGMVQFLHSYPALVRRQYNSYLFAPR